MNNFLYVNNANNAIGCRPEVLATVSEESNGVAVSLYNASSQLESDSGSHFSQRILMTGHRLSRECGEGFFRCQQLLVEKYHVNDTYHSVVFLPLDGGLGMVDIAQTAPQYLVQHHTYFLQTNLGPDEQRCSPSAVFKILNVYLAACTNQTNNFVGMFEIRLNQTSLDNTQILYFTNHITIPHEWGAVANMSNFLHIELDFSHEYILFGVGTDVFSFRPLNYNTDRFSRVRESTCDRIHFLSPRAGAQFYIHCANHFFIYDIGERDWIELDSFDQSGIPYVCPQEPNADLSVFAGYIEYMDVQSLNVNVELSGDAYSDGVCFGNSSHSYFAFRDVAAGASVLDLRSSDVASIPSSACENTKDCYPLVPILQKYLIVRKMAERRVVVMDFSEKPSKVFIEAQFQTSPLTTLVFLECPSVTTPATPGGTEPKTKPNEVPAKSVNRHGRGRSVGVPVGVTVGVVAIVIVGVAITIGIFFHQRKKTP